MQISPHPEASYGVGWLAVAIAAGTAGRATLPLNCQTDRPMSAPLRISVLDQSPIAQGSSGADALRNTIDLARMADAAGFHRYWVA